MKKSQWRKGLRSNIFIIMVFVWVLALIMVGILAHYGPQIIEEQKNIMEKRGELRSR